MVALEVKAQMTSPGLLDAIPVGPMMPLSAGAFSRLRDHAYNLWWTWNADAVELWSMIGPKEFASNPNPVQLLQTVDPSVWEALASNASFVEQYEDVDRRFRDHVDGNGSWFSNEFAGALDGPVAYLCAEYGIEEKLRLYSGGLGVLAGDHLKAASDLGLPFVAVGLLYRRGYFQQAVDPDGNQQHQYLPIEPSRRPLRRVLDPQTKRELIVEIEFPGRTVFVGAWRLDVGRIPLILLDTDIPQNDPSDRPITNVLYVRGREMRLCQEIVLGIGGSRVLDGLNITPAVWHVNEGHAALSFLERLANAGGLDAAVQQKIRSKTLFTLHTPVPAGNEVFASDLAQRYLEHALPSIPTEEAVRLAQARDEPTGWFDLGAMAIRLSGKTNGVSQRHAAVVSRDWGHLLDGDALAITNGVHPQTWVGAGFARIFRRVLGEDWEKKVADASAWKAILDVPDHEVWNAHLTQKRFMLSIVRNRLRDQYARHGQGPDELRAVEGMLPDDRLTIVFARRFATYKRANLLFSDPGRIEALLTNPDRPVQIIFAGKAHPADREGQSLIRWVTERSRSHELKGHVFFVENYDLALGAALVQGADVWLNNPVPPKEASGTSGMKAAGNGGLNLSVLDGWWVEGHDGTNGWGFGEHATSDFEDAGTLYHLLEDEVIPAFADRDASGVPLRWVEMMKHAVASVLPSFSAQRMVREYTEKAYVPLGTS